ncbi:SGNH/GDSL hydrolase family protein [Streptomyces virginiae]|uniref:SGNH/GDSL hydrolase family protein n=1 Tax=Streptomyces virginiae TaxID=1961 RepID=UPI0036849382
MPFRRLAWLLLAALLAVAACTPTAAAATPPTVRVMPLGDSITAGLGSTTGAGYRLPLWNRIAAQSRYRVDYVGSQQAGTVPDPDHEGHRGWQIAQIRAQIDGWLTTAQPRYVLLHIGINDLAWGADPNAAADQLVGLVDQIQARQPGVIIILMGLIPTSAGLQTQVAAYNARARTISRQRFYYVDAPALTPGEMVDELHPNDQGYQRIGDVLYTALNRAEIARQRAGTSP